MATVESVLERGSEPLHGRGGGEFKLSLQITGVSVGQQGKRIRDGIAAKHLAQASRTPGRVSPCRATHREGPGKPGDPNLRRPEVREGLTPQPASAGKGLNILHAHGTATLTR
mgnify:CR=1 FL=1